MNNPKVFEFAKEIGMTPLALMDKIREWQLPVKSHMSELEPEVLTVIRSRLTSVKKPVVKKKAAANETEATKAPKQIQKPTKPAGPVKVAKKTTATPVGAATEEEKPVFKASTGSVVRRKTKAVEVETETDTDSPEASAEFAQVEASQKLEQKLVVVAPAAHPAAANTASPGAAVPSAAAAAPGISATPAAATAGMTGALTPEATAAAAEKKFISRKKEVAIGQSGVSSEMPAQKRNIVGRMDLSRVAKNNPNSSQQGGYSPRPDQRPSFGAQQTGARPKGNLRAGFIQSPQTPPPPDFAMMEENERKKEEKRRMKGGPGEGSGAKPAAEGEVAQFDAAEFRKREMVFQPKKKKGQLNRPSLQTQITQPSAKKRVVKVFGSMKVFDLANELGVKSPELIKVLIKNGVMASLNTVLDFETISLIVPDFQFEAQNVQRTTKDLVDVAAFGNLEATSIKRPPVVAVMGHVDHGKTSLLDVIRKARVADGEAGGITQHIGAYQVKLDSQDVITFLDTPGHEAFSLMRARGANVTDIAIVVVAADDGVMPQTIEAINHAKTAKVPIMIAVNKMDKPGANIEKIKQQLTEYEIVPEEWGGQNIFVPVSALKKTGIQELLDQIVLLSQVMDLKANSDRSATGIVIESRLDKGKGSVATLLVQNGTLQVGQHIVAGMTKGKVRSLVNEKGERVETALPSSPVEIQGLDGVPQAGDRFDVVIDEKAAEDLVQVRIDENRKTKDTQAKVSLEEIFSKMNQGDLKELSVVLKADVAGSLEALQGMFAKLSTPEVKVKIIHSGVGGINESDVLLASTSNGLIIGFNVRPDLGAMNHAKKNHVEIRTYSIVYELIDEMKKAMTGLLKPTIVEKIMGRAEVRNVFTVPKAGTIAGCAVVQGKIARSNSVRLIRNGTIIVEGKIGSLKRFKDDTKEVAEGFECGIGIENFNDIKVGDAIEAFVKEEVARELSAPISSSASQSA